MKGSVFNALQEFVETNHGLEAWDTMLNTLDLPSQGIYTSSIKYDDSEMFSIVTYYCEALNVPASDLLRTFGEFLFVKLMPMAPSEAKQAPSLHAFLYMVDNLIHVEVKKLYADSNLPEFDYADQNDQHLTMIYRSERKLCHLSEGLILGAAKHFGEQVSISQSKCCHEGDDACHIEVRFL